MTTPGKVESPEDIAPVLGAMSLRETMTGSEYQPRPGFGKLGREIPVLANMYQVRFKGQGITIWHYDVDINPVVKVANQKKPKQLMQEVWVQAGKEAKGEMKKLFDAAAFDLVKNAYCPLQFPLDSDNKCEIIVGLVEDGRQSEARRFRITIRPAIMGRNNVNDHIIDLESIIRFCQGNRMEKQAEERMLVAVQAMNILFRQDNALKYKAVGAQGQRFFGLDGSSPLPEGGVVYSGFMQSFRYTQSGLPAVQLDTAYSAFVRPGSLLDVIADILGGGGGGGRGGRGGRGGFRGGAPGGSGSLQSLEQRQVSKLNGILKNAKFQVTHRKTSRMFTMKMITFKPASELTFLLNGRDGQPDKMVSVPEYFKKEHNMQVTKPRLPCVMFGKNHYVPLEFVKLVEYNPIPFAKLTADQTAEMIKVAAKPPQQRMDMIKSWRQRLDWGNLPKVKAWNVEVQANMMQLKARVLNPPQIEYAGKKLQRPNGGQWNMRGLKYSKAGAPLKCWAVVCLDGRFPEPEIKGFVTKLVQNLGVTNCPVADMQPPIIMGPGDGAGRFDVMRDGFSCIKPALQQAAKSAYMKHKMDPQMILVLLPNKDLQRYSEIKRCAAQDLKLPLVTQLLQASKCGSASRGQEQYIGNVSMKVHAKLGGVTHHVPNLFDRSTMMIGADVTHPPQRGDMIPPSIAVSVAATSADNNTVSPCIRLQTGRQEVIADIGGMLTTHLTRYRESAKDWPKKIIMFRDGVSEGQYTTVVSEEFDAMVKACRALDPKYRPKITFVVCAKRHSMRFFAANPADGDKTGNLPAGTVVDTGVCHPFAFDFYLQAHSGLQGTARPTHYIVLKDENNYTADSMQNLCNSLCYTYARACRSVSLIPVAYYSDIIAGRCRDLIYKDDASETQTVSSGTAEKERSAFDPMELKRRIEDSLKFNQVMWYM